MYSDGSVQAQRLGSAGSTQYSQGVLPLHFGIPAGATLGRHTHHNDYILVTVNGEGPVDVQFHDGTGGALGDSLTLRTRRGDAVLVPKGHVETARNDGAEYRAILIELLKD